QLVEAMVLGQYNPGQLQIVREIKYAAGPDFDTAKFQGDLADYTVSTIGGITTVTDGVAGRDGTDRLTHIERLQFSDQAIVLGGLNHAPVGLLTISDPTPTENQLLTVSIAGVTDADNVTGAITGPVAYFWQTEVTPGFFEDLLIFGAGEAARVEGKTFTPGDDEVGLALRVRAVYKDGNGVLEEVFSAPTAPVANLNDPPVGTVVISDTTPTEGHLLTATNAFTDADGLTTAVFAYQWFRFPLVGTVGTPIAGATAATYTPVQADVLQRLQVRVSYVDDQGTAETVASALTGGVGDLILGTAAAETLTGTAFDDDIQGLAGNDTINALAGDDLIAGGTGNDILNG